MSLVRFGVGCSTLCAVAASMLPFACTTFDGALATSVGSVVDGGLAGDAQVASKLDSFLTRSEAARACSFIQRCDPVIASLNYTLALPLDGTNFSACVDVLSGALPAGRIGVERQRLFLKCLSGAISCGQADSCFPFEFIYASTDVRCAQSPADAGGTPATPVADGGLTDGGAPASSSRDRCSQDGNQVIDCTHEGVLHCDSSYFPRGSKCLRGTDGELYCGVSLGCGSAASVCDGNYLMYCGTGDMWSGEDCSSFGWRCGTSPTTGEASCLADYDIRPCTGSSVTCLNDSISTCDSQSQALFDCTKFAGTCSTTPSAHCIRPTDTCTAFDADINVCSGTSIALCVGGTRETFDCSSVGMTCQPAVAGKSALCGAE